MLNNLKNQFKGGPSAPLSLDKNSTKWNFYFATGPPGGGCPNPLEVKIIM